MIKNCLFDIGNVIISWDPVNMAKCICKDEEIASVVCNAVYLSPFWQQVDEGTFSLSEIIDKTNENLDEKYHEFVRRAYSDFPKYVGIKEKTIALIKKLKGEGYRLFLASNFGEKVYDVVKRLHLFDYFEGYVFSFEEKIVKPSEEFFRILLGRYSLKADECVFIDDLQANVDGAEKVGIHGFVFKENQEEAYSYIKSLG